jgi:hypothetical protein
MISTQAKQLNILDQMGKDQRIELDYMDIHSMEEQKTYVLG